MKNFLLILLIIAQVIVLQAQQYLHPTPYLPYKYKVLDSANIKITYRLTYLKDSTQTNNKYSDVQTLLIGSHTSKYFSQQYVDHNNYLKTYQSKAQSVSGVPKGTLGIEIYKDFKNNKLTTTDLNTDIGGSFLYKEDLPQIAWIILNESLTILSYPCQKATTTFRGRKFEAWFTTGVPINNGPWKFGGLPGLILKVSDTQKNYIFECIGIESLSKKEPIKFYETGYKELSREEYNQLLKKYHKNTIPFVKARGGKVLVFHELSGEIEELKTQSFPYNPLEKE
ncbi:MAG: GLPGLI family protein [Bacteroidales bacterium]